MRHITNDWVGTYDNRATRDLYIDEESGLGILVADVWCGKGIEGHCYREHVYYLTPDMATELVAAWGDQGEYEYYMHYIHAAEFAEPYQGKRWGGGDPESALRKWVDRYRRHAETGNWTRR